MCHQQKKTLNLSQYDVWAICNIPIEYWSIINRWPCRGGGGTSYMYAYWVCAARETPIFSPKFPFRSIFTNFQIFRSGASPVYSFCRSGDHNFRNFAAHGRLTQASSLRSPALSRPSHSSSLRSLAFFTYRGAPGLAAGQKRPTVRSGDLHFHSRAPRALSRAPHFHARAPRARSGAQHFYARARSGAHHFSPCRGIYRSTKIWGVYRGGGGGGGAYTNKNW